MKNFMYHFGRVISILFVVALIALVIVFPIVDTVNSRKEAKTDQELLAEIVAERFADIDHFSTGSRPLSLDEAESILYCWASGEEDFTDEEVREAIRIALECTDDIRALIDSIAEIDLDDYRP